MLDGAWHHVALQRSVSGLMEIWVDGALRASVNGPAGDVSYPDDAPARLAVDRYLVLGAAKRDAGGPQLSYRGLVDELRLSTVRRYGGELPSPDRAVRARCGHGCAATTSTAPPVLARPRSPTRPGG